MFSSRAYLEKKTGPHGVGRFSYLQSLVTEFQDSDSAEAKEQVISNLANFAYDPINYDFLKALNVIDLFLDSLTDPSDIIVEFAVAGICNLTLEPQAKEYIIKNDGISLLKRCLSSSREETVLSALTGLMYLVTPASKQDITSLPIIDAMLRFSSSSNPRISNLAFVFLQDYCTERQVARARQAQEELDREVGVG